MPAAFGGGAKSHSGASTRTSSTAVSPATDEDDEAADADREFFEATLEGIHQHFRYDKLHQEEVDRDTTPPRSHNTTPREKNPRKNSEDQQNSARGAASYRGGTGGARDYARTHTYEEKFAARNAQRQRMKERIDMIKQQQATATGAAAAGAQEAGEGAKFVSSAPAQAQGETTTDHPPVPEQPHAATDQELIWDERAYAYYHPQSGYYYDFEGEPFQFDTHGYRCFWDEDMKPYYVDENNDAWYYDDHEQYQEHYQNLHNEALKSERDRKQREEDDARRAEAERAEAERQEKERRRRPKFKSKAQIEAEMAAERGRRLEERKAREQEMRQGSFGGGYSGAAGGEETVYGSYGSSSSTYNPTTRDEEEEEGGTSARGGGAAGGRPRGGNKNDGASYRYREPRGKPAGGASGKAGAVGKKSKKDGDGEDEQSKINMAIQGLMREIGNLKLSNAPSKDRKQFFKKCCLTWHPDKRQDKFVATCVFQWLQEEKAKFLQ
eukprot:g126.t1